jgi:hypothetical protein
LYDRTVSINFDDDIRVGMFRTITVDLQDDVSNSYLIPCWTTGGVGVVSEEDAASSLVNENIAGADTNRSGLWIDCVSANLHNSRNVFRTTNISFSPPLLPPECKLDHKSNRDFGSLASLILAESPRLVYEELGLDMLELYSGDDVVPGWLFI